MRVRQVERLKVKVTRLPANASWIAIHDWKQELCEYRWFHIDIMTPITLIAHSAIKRRFKLHNHREFFVSIFQFSFRVSISQSYLSCQWTESLLYLAKKIAKLIGENNENNDNFGFQFWGREDVETRSGRIVWTRTEATNETNESDRLDLACVESSVDLIRLRPLSRAHSYRFLKSRGEMIANE